MTKMDLVYNNLKEDLIAETYKSGEKLISENEICKMYNVSREPVRRALKKLKERGYLNSKQGVGYIVNPKEFYLNTTITSLGIEHKGQKEVEVIEYNQITNHLTDLFSTKYLHSYKRLIKYDEDIVYEEGYLPFELFTDFNISICEKSILKYFKKDKGLNLSYDVKELESVLVGEEHMLNKYLQPPVTHTIKTTHTLYSDGNVIQHSIQLKSNSKIKLVSKN